jgi:hypothetical protein
MHKRNQWSVSRRQQFVDETIFTFNLGPTRSSNEPKYTYGIRTYAVNACHVSLRGGGVIPAIQRPVILDIWRLWKDKGIRKYYLKALHKVVDESDIVILVLDAQDPEGCKSRLVEEEVRRRESEGKKLVFVLHKIGAIYFFLYFEGFELTSA